MSPPAMPPPAKLAGTGICISVPLVCILDKSTTTSPAVNLLVIAFELPPAILLVR